MAASAVSLKLPNFLTTSQDVTKGADQAIYIAGNALELTDEVHQHQNGVTNGNYGECSSLSIPSETDLEPSPKKQGLENLGQVIVEKAGAEKNDASESNSDINIEELIHR